MRVAQKNKQQQKPWWDAQVETPKSEMATGPLVLVTHGTKGTRISGLCAEGFRQGLWLDMKLNDARAMLPDLNVQTHDVIADRLLHNQFAHWMLRYAPSVALQGRDGFVLDVAGCTHLFGGEAAMARNIQNRFSAMGFTCRLAFADTIAAALALVFHGADELHILPPHAPNDALDVLPIEALRLESDTLMLLKRLGLKHISDVRKLPRAALERRFYEGKKSRTKAQATGLGQSVQWRLDQLSGAMAEPISFITEPHDFRALKQCPALALETGAVEIALQELLPSLCEDLKQAGKGARQFRLTGYRADGGMSSVSANLSQPVHAPSIIARLFKDKLAQIDCGFGIDLFALEALQVSAMKDTQDDIVEPENAAFSSASIAGFADTMANHGNGSNVVKLMPRTSYVPERAQCFAPVNLAVDWRAWQEVEPIWSPRPVRLFTHPEAAQVTAELPDSPPVQFVWRKRLRKVVRSRGPERILPEWWRDDLKAKRSATFRDYYDVEDQTGLRYWMYRAIKDEPIEDSDEIKRTIHWFVHGLF